MPTASKRHFDLIFRRKKNFYVIYSRRKKNKKGKIVESDIRPMIRNFDLLDVQDNVLTLEATIATGSKANLNTNIFIPKILDLLELDMDPLDVDILRRDLYKLQDGQLVSPM